MIDRPSDESFPYSLGTCSSVGDPHYTTFDGSSYDFMGVCRYVLAKDCKTKYFTVVTENTECGIPGSSCSKFLDIYFNDNANSSIRLGHNKKVLIDGVAVSLPYTAPGLTIQKVGNIVMFSCVCLL